MTTAACRRVVKFFVASSLLTTFAEIASFASEPRYSLRSENDPQRSDVQYIVLAEPRCIRGIKIGDNHSTRIRSLGYQRTNQYDQWSKVDFATENDVIIFKRHVNTMSLRIICDAPMEPKNKPDLQDQVIYCPEDHNQNENVPKKRKMFNQEVLDRMTGSSRRKRQLQGMASKLTRSTKLTSADSPYEVNSLVIVPENVDLIIEQGVTLYFEPGTGFLVRGHLIVDGTSNKVIKMLPKDANSTWNGIVVESTKSLSGENIKFEEAMVCQVMGNESMTSSPSWIDQLRMIICTRNCELCIASLIIRNLNQFTFQSSVLKVYLFTAFGSCREGCQSSQKSRTALKSLVVNNAYIGLMIKGYDFPYIEDVTVASSSRDGLVIDANSLANVTARKCRLINNKGYGMRIKTGQNTVSISINEILIAGSQLTGLLLESSVNSVKMIDIRNAAFFNNGVNGLDVQANFELFNIDRAISASNGKYAIFFKSDFTEKSSIGISRLNVTGHWYNAAVVVESSLSSFSMSRSSFWENYNGCMRFAGCMRLISVLENQFSRNRNTIISFNATCPNSTISISNNNYTLNLLNNRIVNQSILAIRSNSTSVNAFHNNFVKNTAFDVILIVSSPKDLSTDIILINNSFKDNLAPNIITVNSSKMNITKNMLDNPVSDCEIRFLNSTPISVENFDDNIWADANAVVPGKKICLLRTEDIPSDQDSVGTAGVVDVATFTSMHAKALGMVPQSLRQNMVELMPNQSIVFKSRNESYKIETSLFIRNGSTVIIEKGTILEMWPDQGIYVFGQLIANGTPNESIIIRSRSLETWSGIYFDNGAAENSSILTYCILDRSNQGLILKSNNLILSNCVISRPKFAGVTLVIDDKSKSKNTFPIDDRFVSFDFDSTKILESQGSGLKIINTKYPVEIRSLIAENVAQNCVDLENDPKFDIRILNSSFSDCQRYAVSIERLVGGSNQTLSFRHNLIANQRGLGGVYISGVDYGSVIVENNTFRNSLVPNLIVILKCNPWIDTVPRFQLIGNKFNLNEDLSADVRLIDCVEANISRNWFNDNNNYRHKGTFRLELEPSPTFVNQSSDEFSVDFRGNTFTGNKGDFSAYFIIDNMNDFRANVEFNRFQKNENRRSSLILGSPLISVHENQFLDEKYGYKLEVDFSDDGRFLNASKNHWSTDIETKILESILDGRKIQGRGKVSISPYLKSSLNETDEFVIDVPINSIDKNESSVESSTFVDSADCSAVKFCHYNGHCIANNVCLCNAGYTGSDCRFFACSALRDCNGNGRCTGPNLCSCYDGWSGRRCETANCSALHDCQGHGTCVSFNECECFNGYMGVDCSQTVNQITTTSTVDMPSVSLPYSRTLSVSKNTTQNISYPLTTTSAFCSFCNYRGTCSKEQMCSCNTGWYGQRCELANCSQVSHCSGQGQCAGPDVCQCFVGYSGKDCATCSNGHCPKVACHNPCLHGLCNHANGMCLCKSGWTGDGCGICENGADPLTSCQKNETQINYILAKNADSGSITFHIHGQDLPNNSICKSNSVPLKSTWISPDYIICNTTSPSQEVITDLHVESFSGRRIQAPKSADDIISSNWSCNAESCSGDRGLCIDNICFCNAGWENKCRDIVVPSAIDISPLSNISSWQEGQPLEMSFHAQNESSKAYWDIVSAPDGASIDPETGIFHWPTPIGSNKPVNITVSATTALGTATLSHSLNIQPSYIPILDQFLVTSDNVLFFNGTTDFGSGSTFLSSVPVDVLFHCASENGDSMTGKIPTTTDGQGRFYGQFPLGNYLLGKRLEIVACHPADCDSVIKNGFKTSGLKYMTYKVQGLRIDPDFVSLSYDFEKGQVDFRFAVKNYYAYNITNIQFLPKQLPAYVIWKSNLTNFDLKSMEERFLGVHVQNLSSFEGFFKIEISSNETATKYAIVEVHPFTFNGNRLDINDQNRLKYQFNGNNYGVIIKIHARCNDPSIANCTTSIDIPLTSGLFKISQLTDKLYEKNGARSLFLIGYKNVTSGFNGDANESHIKLFTNENLTRSIRISALSAMTTLKVEFKIYGEVIDPADNQLHNAALSQVDIQLRTFNDTLHAATNEHGMASALISNCCYEVQIKKEGYEAISTNLVLTSLFYFEFFMKLSRPISELVVKMSPDGSFYELDFEDFKNLSSMVVPYIVPALVNCKSLDKICTFIANLGSSGNIDALNVNWTSEKLNASVWATVRMSMGAFPHLMQCFQNIDRRYQKSLTLSIDFVYADPNIKDNCFAVILQPTFEYMVDDKLVEHTFDLLIKINDYRPRLKLCTISTDGSVAILPYKVIEIVSCDCDRMHKKRCTKDYRSLTLCGQIWNGKTSPSVSTIVQLLTFISRCQYSGVSIDKAMDSIKCLLQQSKFCGTASENRIQSLAWLQSINNKINGAISMDMEPLIRMLHNDYQLYDILLLFKELFDLIQVIFRFSSFDKMNITSWLPEFKRSIVDRSDIDQRISKVEMNRILDNANYESSHLTEKYLLKAFISTFNSTMRQWFRGEQFPEREMIPYSTLQNFTSNLKFLSIIATQHGFSNMFDLLDEYVDDVKYTIGKDSQPCLQVSLKLSKADFTENDVLQVGINVENVRQDSKLEYLSLWINIVDAETLTVVDQLEKVLQHKDINFLSYNQKWETTYTIRLTPKVRLYRNFECRVKTEINFAIDDANSTSIAYSQSFTISPKPSLKLFHFFDDSTIHPSIISFFMNNGYAMLKNLSVITTKLIVEEIVGDHHQTNYSLERVINNGETRIFDLDQKVENLSSGQCSYIKYDLKTDSPSYVEVFDQAVLNKDELMDVEIRKFKVIRMLAFSKDGLPKLLVKNFGDDSNDTLRLFNPDTTMLRNVVLSVSNSPPRESTKTVGGGTYKTLLVTFPTLNLHNDDVILGSLDISFLNETYTRVTLMSRDQEFAAGDFWIDSNSKMNFVDDSIPVNQSLLQYEFVLGIKTDSSLRFIDPPNNVTLDLGIDIGEELTKIRAIGNTYKSSLSYSLIDRKNLFAIDKNSGSITLKENFPIDSNDYCLTVSAQFGDGLTKISNSTMVKVIFPSTHHEDFECATFTYPVEISAAEIFTTPTLLESTTSIPTWSDGTDGFTTTSATNSVEKSSEINGIFNSVKSTSMETTTLIDIISQMSTIQQITPVMSTELTTLPSSQSTTKWPIITSVAQSEMSQRPSNYDSKSITPYIPSSVTVSVAEQTSNLVTHVQTDEISPEDTKGQLSTSSIISSNAVTFYEIITNNNQSSTSASSSATFEVNIDQTLIGQTVTPTDILAYNNEDVIRTACRLRHTKLVYAVICDLGKVKMNPG